MNRAVFPGATAAGAIVCWWLALGQPAVAQPVLLAGITAADEVPGGCIDCHRNAGGKDSRLPVLLAGLKHADVGGVVSVVPGDCLLCHRDGTRAGSLTSRVHAIHYSSPRTNRFVAVHKGSCLACHAIEAETGATRLKIVPKNW